MRYPIHTISVGDSSKQKDIQIKNLTVNEITYLNNKVDVELLVKNTGYHEKNTTVTLSTGNIVLDSKLIILPDDGREKSFKLTFSADIEGTNEYKISLMPMSDESILENNRRDFFVKVLKNKIRVLLIGGNPDPDFAFLSRSLLKDENINLTAFVEKKDGKLFNYDNLAFPG